MAKAVFEYPVRNFAGSIGNTGITYRYNRRTRTAYVAQRPTDVIQVNSPDQLYVRAAISAANKNWGLLTQQVRLDWDDYAKQHYRKQYDAGLGGQQLYVQCMVNRQIMNLPLTATAPLTAPPPGAIAAISAGTASDANELVFSLTHTQAAVAGHRLYVRATPACILGQTPVVAQARAVRHLAGGASAIALAASGVPTTISSTRYAYDDSTQLGLRLEIFREADGMSSTPFFAILTQTIA